MPLQELDHGINQVGKEYGKDEDQKDAPCAVHGGAHNGKEQYRQQDVRGAALREGHWLLSVREEIFEVPTPPLSAHSLYLVECTRVCLQSH